MTPRPLDRLACLASALLALLALPACGDDGHAPPPYAGAYHTPLDLPQTGTDTADPHVIHVGDTWYLYPTSGGDSLSVWTSTDLVDWTYGGVVWEPTPGTWNDLSVTDGYGAWAPSVHPGDDGAFYLYYTAGLRIGVAKADSPLGPFVDQLDHPLAGDGYGGVGDGVLDGTGRVDLIKDFEEFAIDAFVLRTSTGAHYLYAAIYTPLSTIAVWPMDDMVTLGADAPTVVGQPNLASWEGPVMEGPFVVEEGGRFLLTYSGNDYQTTNYAIGAATADDPMGPFTKYAGNPVFATDPDREIWGPGHHSFVDGCCGDTLIFYHAKTSSAPGADRTVRFGPVTFDDDPPFEVLFP